MFMSIVFTWFAAHAASAEASRDCASRLSERYGTESSEALQGFPTHLRTLRAEPGSIADRDPTVLREVARIVRSLARGPSVERLVDVEGSLDDLLRDRRDPRLAGLLRVTRRAVAKLRDVLEHAPPEFLPAPREWRTLESHGIELLVALMTAGEVIYLNPFVTDLHPELMNRNGDREIDVIAVARDGSERWIEVKSWGRFDETSDRLGALLCKQARATGALREHLGNARVRRELVMRRSLPPAFSRAVLERTGYDRIGFLFLDPPEDLTPRRTE